jgi:DNA-binding response OmpR family regulator
MGEKILIVDDDLESVKLIGLMLQRRGYEITAAQDGSQALIKAETEAPDLVILDVMMPDMDGYQVCQQLRSNPRTAHLPVLMFTAKTLVGDKVAGFQAGADDYLTKPIHPAELVSRVEALLQRSEAVHTRGRRLSRARIIGVMGAKGGVGASTLVVNLAAAAHQHDDRAHERDGPTRVSIADLRTGLGSVALLMGQMPQGGLANLMSQDPRRLDEETIESQIVTHASGLRYLPASLQPESGQSHLPVAHVSAVLSRMAATADYLFLDLGSVLDEATRHAIARCDVVVVVVEPERLCLTLARALLDKIKSLDPPPGDLCVFMVERIETGTAYTQTEVEDLLGHRLTGVINLVAGVARQAVEQGQPIVLMQPESEIAGQLRDLSQKLLA